MADDKKVLKTFVGADGRTLTMTAKESGSAYNLTGLTVTLTATYGGETKIDGQTCTVTNAAGGVFTYTPSAAEIDEAGDYRALVKLTSGSNDDFLDEFILRVQEVL